ASLDEIAADPEFASPGGHPGSAAELVGRSPGWAGLVLRLHRAWLDNSEAVLALAGRLNPDPYPGDSVPRMLTNAASIRAAAEVLEDGDSLTPADRGRFLPIVADDAQKLSGGAKSLLDFFDGTHIRVRSATPVEHLD